MCDLFRAAEVPYFRDYIFSDLVAVRHPVHFLTKDGNMSPSAFIPFCEFGGNISVMSVNIEPFKVPVCNSFQEVILNNQLCYEVDLNRFSNLENIERELKIGFIFMMDYNEDRQITFGQDDKTVDPSSYSSKFVEYSDTGHAVIYLDTIGK